MSMRVMLYRALERLGVHVTPANAKQRGYYSPLPNTRELAASLDAWAHPSEMVGVDITVDEQLRWLTETVTPYRDEIAPHRGYSEAWRLGVGRDGYGPIEAHVHHCVLRRYAPACMLEIGSGVSTVVARRASSAALTAIEPFPNDALRQLCAAEGVALIDRPAQAVALREAERLRSGDVLFIDSSHAVKPGADAPFLVTEVVPRLAPGVLIHVHDIHFPYGYQPNALTTPFIWAETWLWWALLIHSARFRVLASLSWLHYERSEALGALFPDYEPRHMPHGLDNGTEGHYPSSLWLMVQTSTS